MDSIFALSTPPGGAIAVIRVSGGLCTHAAQTLTGKDLCKTPRVMTRAYISYKGSTLDDAMAAFFKAPKSYTGEDMLELYCHGSQAVIRAVYEALSDMGLRPAEPGEFTRRAFLNGKLDLIEAEAVMDLIQSEADLSAKSALLQMQGRLSREIEAAEELLYDALSALNASIDYPEELEEDVFGALPHQLEDAKALLSRLIDEGMRSRALREGYRVVLLGSPNAGKSSLYNALLGYERAIVTPEAGTTRDILEETMLIDGIPVRITDTAGLREAENDAERQGVIRAREACESADAIILLLDGAKAPPKSIEIIPHERTLLLRSKADLNTPWDWGGLPDAIPKLSVSAKTGEGIGELIEWIKSGIGPVADAYITNRRHIDALRQALISVNQAAKADDVDEIATDIRDALLHLGTVTGKSVDEDVIERIFERFCVGK